MHVSLKVTCDGVEVSVFGADISHPETRLRLHGSSQEWASGKRDWRVTTLYTDGAGMATEVILFDAHVEAEWS